MQPNSSTLIPKHIEAERRLIGGILALNSNFDELPEDLRLTAEHFSDRVLGQIWDWIVRCLNRGMTVDEHVLAPVMRKLSSLDETDPKYLSPEDAESYLETLTSAASVITMKKVVIDSARVVKNYALWREAQNVGQELVDVAGEATPDQDPAEMIGQQVDRLVRIQSTGIVSGRVTLSTAILQAIAKTEEAQLGKVGISTGLRCVDARIGGLQKSAVIVLAGATSMGKTALALNMARNAAEVCLDEQEGSVIYASYEMPPDQLARRIIANEVSLTIDKQVAQRLSPQEHERRVWEMEQAQKKLARLPLLLDGRAPKNIQAFSSYAKRAHRETGGLRLIVADYLQLMSGQARDRVQEIAEITRGLKALAIDLDVPVVALSQLSRKVDEREDNRPQMSDLREGGSIEHDADVVMFAFRRDYYLKRREPATNDPKYTEWCDLMQQYRGKAELITAKCRQGEIGTDMLEYEGQYFLFKEPSYQPKAR